MKIEIINTSFKIDIYGFGGIALNKDYTGTAFRLSGKMWETVKAKDLKNKGKKPSKESIEKGLSTRKKSFENGHKIIRSQETKQKLSALHLLRVKTEQKHICPHCQKSFLKCHLNAFHLDKCKYRSNI